MTPSRSRRGGARARVRAYVTGDGDLRVPVVAALEQAGLEPVDGDRDHGLVVAATRTASREWLVEARELREHHGVPVIGVVDEVPTPYVMRTLVRWLEGVVLLDAIDSALAPTVQAVLSGQAAHPLAFREHLDQPVLSAREKQVLAMVVLGFANIEIAQKLFVTEASVKAHLTSAFAKLGVRSRDAATALILDPESGYGPGILRITPDAADAQR